MGKILYLALKLFLWLLLFTALAGATYLLVLWKGWPLWTGAAILLGPIGLLMGVVFIRRHLARRRERRYVNRIVEQEPDKLAQAQAASRITAVSDLRASFARALEILRRSRLTRFANPVYALPWVLLIGETGSGKTSALRAARLNATLSDPVPPGPPRASGACEWWFLEGAVLLDLSGSLVDTAGDADGWREFLSLLARYRRREPLSGLVVTVPADRLLGEPAQVTDTARAARRRVDELMRVLGARFPIYILVTKLDRVPGFEGFCARLDTDETQQAMGVLNAAAPDKPQDRAGEILDAVAERLKALRLSLADRPGAPTAGLPLFPQAFGDLEQGLGIYCRELFQKTPYLETPLFRGLYFASADSDAVPPTPVGPLGQFPPVPTPEGRRGGVFLHDLFARVLPHDRRLHSPLPAFLSWRDVTRFSALGAVLALAVCLLGLSIASYRDNARTLAYFSSAFTETPKLTRNLGTDADMMLRLRNAIVDMEKANANWDLPRMGLHQSEIAEAEFKELFCDLFKRGMLVEFDRLIADEARTFSDATPPEQYLRFAAYVVDRIRLVDAAMNGKTDPQAAATVYDDLGRLVFKNARIDPAFADRYETLHQSYLAWNTHRDWYVQERDALSDMLRRVLRADRIKLDWLVNWANELPGLSPVTMEQFWGATALEQRGLAFVAPAYTLSGYKMIMKMAGRIQDTLTHENEGRDWLSEFKHWYGDQYVAAWERFAQQFSSATQWERSREQWRTAVARMCEPDSPYLMLLAVMGDQLAPFADRKNNPTWVAPVMHFNFMRLQAMTPQKATIEEKLTADAARISNFFKAVTELAHSRFANQPSSGAGGANQPATSQPTAAGTSSESPATAAQPGQTGQAGQTGGVIPGSFGAAVSAIKGEPYFIKYLNALRSLRDAMQSPASSVSLIGSRFSPQPAPAQPSATGSTGAAATSQAALSPFDAANAAVKDLETALGGTNAPLFDDLLVGPLRFFWGVGVIDAAAGLQGMWVESVVVNVSNMPQEKLPGALFDPTSGLVWKFVAGPAKPFLAKSADGYSARTSNGTTFPFTSEFLEFLNKGSTQTQKIMPSYDVSATALPTDVNKDAKQAPYATELTLDCQEKVQQLINYNYPLSQVFHWNPNTCGKTVLKIRFPSFTASRTYHGAMGFAHFLKEFQYNTKKFSPDDFPEAKGDCAIFGVRTITVQYKLSGGVPLIELLKAEHYTVPGTIANAWQY